MKRLTFLLGVIIWFLYLWYLTLPGQFSDLPLCSGAREALSQPPLYPGNGHMLECYTHFEQTIAWLIFILLWYLVPLVFWWWVNFRALRAK